MKIAIIGAGIGGLTLALALRARGIEATLYEQAAELSEIGAAVALSANATRELQRLGLIDQLERTGVEPTELIYRDGLSGDRLRPMRCARAVPIAIGSARPISASTAPICRRRWAARSGRSISIWRIGWSGSRRWANGWRFTSSDAILSRSISSWAPTVFAPSPGNGSADSRYAIPGPARFAASCRSSD